jgi:hypothetical protein
MPQLTEPQSDFGTDPLTLPPKGKNKSKSSWTIIKPNTKETMSPESLKILYRLITCFQSSGRIGKSTCF